MTQPPLWHLSAAETARATRAGEVTAEAVTEAALARMAAVNPALNAVVAPLDDSARAAARDLDAARARGVPPGPLHGVPLTIKINVDQAGEATTNGIGALRDHRATEDAPIVRSLRRAGAVIIGRTNTPEFSFRAETDNPVYGLTRNPWGDHVSAGGSSGGAGAAVMAGVGALAHGNDIGGSLRFPAAATGAVTVKPGLGRVPAWNPSQQAERGMLAQSMSVQGVLARHVADLALALPVICGPDARDPWHVPMPFAGPPVEGKIRVAFTANTYEHALHPEVAAALTTAREALTDAGYLVEEVETPSAHQAGREGYRALMGEVQALMGPGIRAQGSATVNAIFEEYFRQFPPFEGAELLQVMARRSHHAREWSVFLETWPLVLTPFLPQPFYRPLRDTEGEAGVREVLGAAVWSYSMNFIGLPVGMISSRLSRLPQGDQPTAVQIVGRRWREDLILDAMAAIETRCGRMSDLLFARI